MLTVHDLVAGCQSRGDLAKRLPMDGVGAELGVAEGGFSRLLLSTSTLRFLYSIDRWADLHDATEYRRAVRTLDAYRERNAVWRMTFSEARPLIANASLDFLYIDGYAHTGEEGGQTIAEWWSAVKPGGIVAGDDYDPVAWPLVVDAVDRFVARVGTPLAVILASPEPDDPIYGRFPTWVVIR